MEQPTLPGLEPTVEHRAIAELVRGLRDYGLVNSQISSLAGHDEARALLGYLQDAGLLIPEQLPATEVELHFERTCMAMPEQYEVFRDGRQIGYLRLRHGHFRAHYPDHDSREPVYSTGVRGDGFFHDDEERSQQLHAAAVEILKADGVENPVPRFEIPLYELEDELDWDNSPLFALLAARAEEQRARLEELQNQRRQELYRLVDENLDRGASSTELVDALESAEYLSDRLPQGYGESTTEA